jgi:hypothetical protein
MTANVPEHIIPCPKCGKRLFDAKGHDCSGDFAIEIKCRNTKSCGLVWITAQHIEKMLDKGKTAEV